MGSKSITGWFKEHLPTFDVDVDKHFRTLRVRKYSQICLLISFIIICVVIPSTNCLLLTNKFFKICHHLKHHVFNRRSWIHKTHMYHKQSLQLCLACLVFTSIFVFQGANRDLLEITKRMGRISVALMPPLLFLTLRPSPLPHTLYLALLPLHKWISRIVVLESVLHTWFYLYYMYINDALYVKMRKLPNIYGVIALGLFLLIAITSIRYARRWSYRVFYYVHYISTWLIVVLLHYHARPGISYYTTLNVIILTGQIVYRLYISNITRATVVPISSSLSLLEFPLADLPKRPILPGGHLRINIYHRNFLRRWLSHLIPFQHPFTIASIPSDNLVRLIIRNGHFPLRTNEKYYITGAFEPELSFISKPSTPFDITTRSSKNPFRNNSSALINSPLNFIIKAQRVFMCVGGSGISFGLPLLRILNFNGVNVRLLWVSRDYKDLEVLNHFKNNFEGMEIYISGTEGSEQDIEIDYIDYHGPSSDLDNEGSNLSSREQVSALGDNSMLSDATAPRTEPNENTALLSKKSTLRTHQSTNASGIPDINADDEIDFTYTFSRSKSRKNTTHGTLTTHSSFNGSNVFRQPKTIEPPAQDPCLATTPKKIRIPAGVKVYFGRPTLGDRDYEWCLQSECDAETDSIQCCRWANQGRDHAEYLSQVWVLAAGPRGLIESTRRWATDGGLHFHGESFAL
ncbi:hypothetical protein SKDZ_12G1000 [Saccharomyces kudriavzevii ZP591]|nr:hypothetical protein SKDZ_12G1000 [Saccharomyces kudriavzevii ZP591]